MFVVTEAQAAAIRTAYEQRGEFSAAVELRQLFLALRTMGRRRNARGRSRWRPLPKRLSPMRLRVGKAS
jgi:hypothetical protein